MEALSKFLALLFVVALSVFLNVGIMVYGWGLQPKSWWWIIGGGVFAFTALRSLADALTKNKK